MSSQTPPDLSPASSEDVASSARAGSPQRSTSPKGKNATDDEHLLADPSLPIPAVTLSTPNQTKKPKDKKKVGFAATTSAPKEAFPRPEVKAEPTEEDYFSHTPLGGDSAGNTPGAAAYGHPGPASRRDSFDRDELTEALEKILKPEDHSGPRVAANLTLPPLPRPVLRKNVYPDSPAEPVLGLSHPSEVEARHRAGRLAESVSGLASRTSVDLDDESQFGLLVGGTEARDHAYDNTATASGTVDGTADVEGLTYRRRAQSDADKLVRKHTARRAKEHAAMSGMQTPDVRSGTSTPVAYDLEYVPPAPTKYLGGIMGSLLKLYTDDRNGSGTTTPGTATPNRTPRSSPPATTPGTPRVPDTPSGPPSRPRSGLFGLGSRHSASTLAELVGSSSTTLVAPASFNGAGKDFSDLVTGNLKKEREKKSSARKSARSLAKAQQLLVTKQ